MDYSKTINLPQTDFPMKANLLQREPEIQQRWAEMDIYARSLEKPAPLGKYILHDGPPYSNGNVHIGNALQNKIPKDIIVKYRTMAGFNAPYVPGWDNHGMPIELQVAKLFREEKKVPTKLELRQRCREFAAQYVNLQREQYKRLGIRGDWENPYLTMSTDFEAAIVKTFGELAKKGYVYRGLRPIHWCTTCETALALAEVEYEDHTSPSIYVSFPMKADPKEIFAPCSKDPETIIWTTTPWTIPANLAVAVHPEMTYALAETADHCYLVAESLLEKTMAAIGVAEYKVLVTYRGDDLDGLIFKHPVFDRDSLLVLADYVSDEEGTGVVHTAPGHGREDFETGVRYGLPILNPVSPSGHYTEEAGQFAGLPLKQANEAVLEALSEAGHLLAREEIAHSYPHCWRCHRPVIFRTTVQWFMGLDHNDHRRKCLEEIKKVKWLAPDGEARMSAMVTGAPDWCLSRQRSWGVGIPVFFCKECDTELITDESLDAVHALVAREGSDAWFAKPADEILPPSTHCGKCGGTEFRKETDVLDVWFDSGSTWNAVLEARSQLRYPADLYLEGYDQYRGWFNSSMNVSMGVNGQAPYKAVLTHGFGLDAQGRAMHKSRGNVVQTTEVVKKYGADIIRLVSASIDVLQDARISDEAMTRTADVYRRIRNTFRFLLGNLYDFDPAKDAVPYGEMMEIDRWALGRLQWLIQDVTEAYRDYQIQRVYHDVHTFCTVDLSSLYLDVIKDRLYSSAAGSPERRSAQTALHHLAEALVRIVTPILSHTAEEVWSYMPGAREESPQLADFPEVVDEYRGEELLRKWDRIIAARGEVNRAIEVARQDGTIGKPLEAKVAIKAGGENFDALASLGAELPRVMIVSQASLEKGADDDALEVTISKAEGAKCGRCWLTLEDVGKNAEHPELCARCATAVEGLEAS